MLAKRHGPVLARSVQLVSGPTTVFSTNTLPLRFVHEAPPFVLRKTPVVLTPQNSFPLCRCTDSAVMTSPTTGMVRPYRPVLVRVHVAPRSSDRHTPLWPTTFSRLVTK